MNEFDRWEADFKARLERETRVRDYLLFLVIEGAFVVLCWMNLR